ncbi:hypothetical protein [Sulfitobacter sp. THAF37]|uniref:hypothetical protein n=1 Tax=Sulfitobacter sp. THAF37 TaxID=2587855 RepID=UPI001268BA6E|nr:hypothetical protein [Sulfitobacter sp. THAF37]
MKDAVHNDAHHCLRTTSYRLAADLKTAAGRQREALRFHLGADIGQRLIGQETPQKKRLDRVGKLAVADGGTNDEKAVLGSVAEIEKAFMAIQGFLLR